MKEQRFILQSEQGYNGRMEGWKNGKMEKCGNSTPDSYRGGNERIEEWKVGKME